MTYTCLKQLNRLWLPLVPPEACNFTALISSSGNSLDTAEATKIILSTQGTISFPRSSANCCILTSGFLKWKLCLFYNDYMCCQKTSKSLPSSLHPTKDTNRFQKCQTKRLFIQVVINTIDVDSSTVPTEIIWTLHINSVHRQTYMYL